MHGDTLVLYDRKNRFPIGDQNLVKKVLKHPVYRKSPFRRKLLFYYNPSAILEGLYSTGTGVGNSRIPEYLIQVDFKTVKEP